MKKTSRLVRVGFVVGLIFGLCAPTIAATKDCALKPITSIDLIVAEGGTVIVPVELNGKKAGLTLQLEGIASFITPGSADAWSLPRQKAPRDIMFGTIKVTEMAQYETLTVGDLKYNNGFFLVVPAPMHANTIEGREVVGFLSGSAFNGTDFELDVAHKKLNIFSQDHCPGDMVYWADKFNVVPLNRGRLGEFSFPMDLEGKKVQATITTMIPATTVATHRPGPDGDGRKDSARGWG